MRGLVPIEGGDEEFPKRLVGRECRHREVEVQRWHPRQKVPVLGPCNSLKKMSQMVARQVGLNTAGL